MSINTESLASVNKATSDFLLSAANTALGSSERFTNLNIETTRSVFENSVSKAKALMDAKDLQEAIAIQASLAEPSNEIATAYFSSLYEIFSQNQEALTQMLEVQFGDFQKSASSLFENTTKSAPAGSEIVVAALRSTFNATNTAFNNMNNVAKQFVETAQSNMAAATSAAVKSAEKKLPKASVQ